MSIAVRKRFIIQCKRCGFQFISDNPEMITACPNCGSNDLNIIETMEEMY